MLMFVVVFAADDDVGVVDDSVYVDVDFLCLLHFKYVKSWFIST